MSVVQVLGTGCSRCGHRLKAAEEAVSQLSRNDSVEKVDDIDKILDFAPNALPALAIDGKVVFAGGMPSVYRAFVNRRQAGSPRFASNSAFARKIRAPYNVLEHPVHVRDLHAMPSILAWLQGLDSV